MLRERMRRSNSSSTPAQQRQAIRSGCLGSLVTSTGFGLAMLRSCRSFDLLEAASAVRNISVYIHTWSVSIDGRPRLGIMLKANTAQTLEGFAERGL